ncbi:MAG TPA: GLPGLI family protein [Chitinophagaceae bacterium]|nr:GLPGLI family protein [Chitinophagaceae bacterium]
MTKIVSIIYFTLFLGGVVPEQAHQVTTTNATIYDHLVVYKLTYQKDSTDPTIKEAKMALLLGKEGSVFGVYGNLNRDTAKFLDQQRGGRKFRFKTGYPVDYYIDYRIFKEKDKILTYDRIAAVQAPIFNYTENKADLKWRITEDTATIAGYFCQKAVCELGNRTWNAWFTAELPISDGPYKFCGLPGLIIQVSDSRNFWNFSLLSLENKPYTYYDDMIRNKESISTSKSKFLSLLKSSYDNGFEVEQQYGLTFKDQIDEQKEYYQQRAKKENNWIEKISP